MQTSYYLPLGEEDDDDEPPPLEPVEPVDPAGNDDSPRNSGPGGSKYTFKKTMKHKKAKKSRTYRRNNK
jgi:hypothetical protein